MMQQLHPEKFSMTLDEVSMERSKNFVKALQELKNLRPQLYSAAEYCEKSYLNNEQKQMVLDNLKDYAVRAVVNAIDHLGTVASKLNDLFEQQTLDVSTVDQKISCLNQGLLDLLESPELDSVNRKVQNCLLAQTELKHKNVQTKPRPHPTAPKTLSWHLASETKSSLDGVNESDSNLNPKASGATSQVFHLIDHEEIPSLVSFTEIRSSDGFPAVSPLLSATAATRKDPSGANKSLLAFRSFDQPGRREVSRPPPARSKSMLSAFFVKHKSAKLKMSAAS